MTETNGNLCYLKGDMTYIKKFPGKIFEPKKSFRKELKGMKVCKKRMGDKCPLARKEYLKILSFKILYFNSYADGWSL